MGLRNIYLTLIESVLIRIKKPVYMLELGNQLVRDHSTHIERTGKQYFQNRGVVHTSVDRNGKDGAVVRNLCKPDQFTDWRGRFDIVTNIGTSEHVAKQNECFQIIDSCVKIGGYIIHVVPDIDERNKRGTCAGHCNFYYTAQFFIDLAKTYRYEILRNDILDGLRAVIFMKR